MSHLALDWLREVLQAEFAVGPDFGRATELARAGAARAASKRPAGMGVNRMSERLRSSDPFEVAARYARGDVDEALWYREWYRRWRRFQLPHRLTSFASALGRARAPHEVYATLSQHAVQIVGGYTCLVFPPQADSPLRALPNPHLRVDAGRLTISMPLQDEGLIGREDLGHGESGPLASLAPLFSEERAVSLAHARFGDGGVILLVERRQERVFEPEDWELLRLLSAEASAALARVRVAEQIDLLTMTDPLFGLPDGSQLDAVLEHAWALADHGEPITLLALRLEGMYRVEEDDGPAAADRVRRTVAEATRELIGSLGIVLSGGPDAFLLVLPRLIPAQTHVLVERVQRQLPNRVRIRFGVAGSGPSIATPAELVAAVDAAFVESETNPGAAAG